MRILLLRHGTAEPRSPDREDQGRRLIGKGRRQIVLVAKLLRDSGFEPDLVLTSPYPRALDSAEELCRAASGLPRPEIEDALAPDSNPARALEALLSRPASCLLAVGHEPLLSQLAARLVGAEGLRLDLRKGSMIEIELPEAGPETGVLLGLVRPRYLR